MKGNKKKAVLRKVWLSVLIIIALISSSAGGLVINGEGASSIQTATPANNTDAKIISSEDALISSVNNMLSSSAQPSATRPSLPKVTYTSDFSWEADQTLKGIYTNTELFFSLPDYWDVKYACVQLQYRVSQLMKEIPGTLTFSINKQPFYSCGITYRNMENNILYVLIPKELLKNDKESRANYLQISGYARLYNEQGCIDQSSNSNWISISKVSGVEVGYDLKPHNNRLDLYPYPFMSSDNKTGAGTKITIASPIKDEELTTAVMVMNNLSKKTVGDNNLTICTWEDSRSMSYSNRVLVALTSDLPGELTKYIEEYKGQLKGQVMLLFVKDDSNKPLLIIISDDADCLKEAGYLLGDNDRVKQQTNSVAMIKKGAADIKINATKQSDLKADRYTLQEMTGGGYEFIGPFRQVKTLFLPVPTDYALASASKVTLNFRYSKNLDFRRSMLTVYWGDIPVGSKKLSLDNADNDELTFFMPADVVGTNSGSMKFAFDLELQDLLCTTRQDEMPWAYITKDSSVYLPFDNNIKLDFTSKPAPFQKRGALNNILLVIPDKPTVSDLTLMGRISALYSKTADGYGSIRVCRASEFSEKDSNNNIILIGTPFSNSLITRINDKLYFRYSSDGASFITNEKLVLSEEYARSVGTLQLLNSPYAEGRAMLVVTAPNDAALRLLTKLISNEKMSWNLSKDFVLIDSQENVKSYQFQTNELKEEKPTIVQSISDNKNSLLFALAATSVMLVLFLAIILIIVRFRLKQK